VLQAEIEKNAVVLTEINPKIEDLKKKLELKQSQIMDVGGSQYRELKRELEELSKKVSDRERQITRNKTTLSSSDLSMRKLDQEIARSKEEIDKLNKAKVKLTEELQKNDKAGNALLIDM
jgi:chromosome segregation ATPase